VPDREAGYWDDRYRASETVWGVEPNRFVAAALADLPPGDAIDLACGEGRNAIWLARRGWRVTAADFSEVALDRGRALAPDLPVDWVHADVTAWDPPPADLVVVCYLQLTADPLAAALDRAVGALRPGGTFFLVAHDSRNLREGTGGPQDPSVLYGPAEVTRRLEGLRIDRAETVPRPVEGAPRPALDVLVQAVRVAPARV
jgi:SAM-dependent methyltransferase